MHVHGVVNNQDQLVPLKSLRPAAQHAEARFASSRTPTISTAASSTRASAAGLKAPDFPQPAVARPDFTPPTAEKAPGTGPLTLDGLLEAWGETESPYDLNGDSIVNSIDLLQLLASMSGAAGEAGQSQDGDMPLLTVDDLKKAWGETDSVYDLDGSGVVDVNDLMKLLAEGGTMPHPDAPVTVKGLMEAWGTPNAHYDLTEDGIVDTADLMALLAKLEADGAGTGPGEPQESVALGDPKIQDHLAALRQRYVHHGAERVADRLIGAIESTGAESPDHGLLASLMSSLEIRPTQRELVMQRLVERFGQGGLDTIG